MAVLEGKSGRVADTDEARFEAIYSSCATAVLAYLLRRLPPADAKDVAAEAFVVVWRRLAEVPSDPLPWVISVARNQLRKRLPQRATPHGAEHTGLRHGGAHPLAGRSRARCGGP